MAFNMSACSKQQAENQTVAEVNSDAIRVGELREFLGVRAGVALVAGVTAEQKSQALDRLIAGRLLAQDARTQGLDNTDAFRSVREGSEQTTLITALLRKEIDAKAKVTQEEVRAEAKKMMSADNTLTDDAANIHAGRQVSQAKIRKVQEELIESAKKEFPATIDKEMVERIVGGGAVPDNAVLGTVAGDNVTYGTVKQELENVAKGMPGGLDIARNPVAINRILARETTGRSLAAYARKQGIEGSDWHKSTREDIERTILIELLVAKTQEAVPPIGDKEVDAYYKENPKMFAQHGKKVPLATVKEQLRRFLQNEKRKAAINAYVEELKKKARITVNEKVLAEV